MKPSTRRLLIAGILLGAVAIAAVMVNLRPDPPRLPPSGEAPLVVVDSAVAGEGPITVFGSGSVRPRAEIDLAPEVTGKITYVTPALQSGGRVSRGTTLFRIDASDYENRVRQAEAEVAAQRVSVLQAQQEAEIARTEYEQFLRRRARNPTTGAAGVDPDDYAARVARTRSSAAAPPAADSSADPQAREPSPLVLREPQLQAAQAALARAEAQLADAQLALDRTEVVAPFDGIVRDETADVGRFVAAGQSVARIYAADAVEVVVPLSDRDAVLIPDLWSLEAGREDRRVPAVVTTEYGRISYAWDGYVDRAETALDDQSRTIDVVVRVPDPFVGGRTENGDRPPPGSTAPPLLVGQFAEIRIDGVELEEYIVLPRRALRPGNEVWVVDAGGRVRVVTVQVLQESDDRIYATGDVSGGELVITAGVEVATNGMRVRIQQGGGP